MAETLRIATFNTELKRKGPGLLLRDILRGKDDQIDAVRAVIGAVDPDILVLQGFDYDLYSSALVAFTNKMPYPHWYSARPNTGMATLFDMDGDGQRGTASDAQGYGRFSGQGGMAVLSKFPILDEEVQDFSALLWQDAPRPLLPSKDGKPFPSAKALAAQRLSSTNHWIVPIAAPGGTLNLLTFHATPPVFDGPEDRNGKRNHDEITLWAHVMDGTLGTLEGDFVIAGDANLDPHAGAGRRVAIAALLNDPRLIDPAPSSPGSLHASGDPFDTVDWKDPTPGNLRVDYVLPSASLSVTASGVFWPGPNDPMAETAKTASRHRLVWVEVTRPSAVLDEIER